MALNEDLYRQINKAKERLGVEAEELFYKVYPHKKAGEVSVVEIGATGAWVIEEYPWANYEGNRFRKHAILALDIGEGLRARGLSKVEA